MTAPPAPSDAEIIELLRQPARREEGFRYLLRKYSERLYAHVRRMVGNHSDTDDVLQNTFLKVHRHVDNFEGRSQLYTWLYRIASNEALTLLQKRKRLTVSSLDDPDAPVGQQPVAAPYQESEEIQRRLFTAIGTLPEKQRLVFNLRYFDELSYQEMSDLLGTSVGGLKASFHHAVKKVEQHLRDTVTG